MLEKGFEMDTKLSTSQIPPADPFVNEKMFHVLNYSPTMGRGGTTLTIDTLFNPANCHDVHIRIVIGCRPIPTVIKNIGGSEASNLWRCTGTVPEFASQKYASTHTVGISIEAIVRRNVVLDSVAFGYFLYQEYGLLPSIPLHPEALGVHPREGSPLLHATRPPTPQPVPLHQATQSRTPSAPVEGEESKPNLAWKRILRRYECRGIDSDRVSLRLEGDLKGLGKNLSDEEIVRHRRLIRFIRKEEGNTLRLFFYPIRQEDYEEGFFVISCIYREDSRDTWCTSVDMMKLIEYISQDKTSDKEKGRIRRNLEFLHPTTVSRMVKPQLFQMLMDFPMPKPRTIEKAIKVFKWTSLVAGLNKVMEKYSWFRTGRLTPCLPARPRSSMHNNFHVAPQCPASDALTDLTPFDDDNAPATLTQPEAVLATHVNPSWLHSQTLATPFVYGDMPYSNPRFNMTPDTEVSRSGQTLPLYESFHHFENLQTISIA